MSAFSLPFPYSHRAPAPVFHRSTEAVCATDFKSTATLLARYQGSLKTVPDGHVEVGLLVQVPSSEGGNVQEVTSAGYQRQPVQFRPMRGGVSQRNAQTVQFEFDGSGSPPAMCLGVFVGGQLYFYGRLQALPGSTCPLETVTVLNFAPETIQLAFRREA